MMRIISIVLVAFGSAMLAAQAPSPRELFERARMLDETNQNVADAIVLYRRVADESRDRELAANAHLRIGLLHERLGQHASAHRAFQAVVEGFPDQAEVLRQARERLTASLPPRDGLASRRVWAGLTVAPLGTVSPNGKYLSFTDWSDGNLAVRDLTAGTTRTVTSGGLAKGGFAYGSIFSPDGAALAFNWVRADTSALELRSIRLDTGKEAVLFRDEQLNYFQPFDWSQDGQRILTLFNRLDRTNQIALIQVSDGTARVLKTLDWRAPAAMSFSPDGRWIAYDFPPDTAAPERDLFVLAADGSSEMRVVGHPADDAVLGWTPDGRHLLFSSDRGGTRAAWTVAMRDGRSTGSPHPLRLDLGRQPRPLGFSRTGAFFYFSASSMSEVFTASLDGASGRVTDPIPLPGRFVGDYESADWSPDGDMLAVVRQPPGIGDKRLLLHSETGSRDISLALSPANWPRWSPDGRSILISGRNQKTRRGFFRVDAATGDVTELLVEDSIRLRADWGASGRALLFARRTDDCLCVIRRDLATGDETVLFRTARSDRQMTLATSPDGAHVAVLWYDESQARPTLTLIPAAGDARVVYAGNDLAWFSLLAWTPDSRAILFGRHDMPERGRVGLWRVPVSAGEPAFLGLAMEGLRDLRVRPDGRAVVFTAGATRGDVWMVENVQAAAQVTPARRR